MQEYFENVVLKEVALVSPRGFQFLKIQKFFINSFQIFVESSIGMQE